MDVLNAQETVTVIQIVPVAFVVHTDSPIRNMFQAVHGAQQSALILGIFVSNVHVVEVV